jgi:cytidine deaminase
MKTVTRECHFKVYDNENELEPADAMLLQEAIKAVDNAYAPYSHFHVGAALQLSDGEIIHGSNQENSAYPSGLCAERVALFRAGAVNNSLRIRALAVTARTTEMVLNQPVNSCGACLQVMADFERRSGNQMRVILRGETGEIYVCDGIVNLMPLIFEFK